MGGNRLRSLLRLTRIPHFGPRSIARLLDLARARPDVLEEFIGWDADTLRTALHCHPRAVDALLTKRSRIEADTDLLLRVVQRTGIEVLAQEDPDYPSTLAGLPEPAPLITLYGNRDILFRPRAAIVSSREPGPLALHATHQIAALLAEQGVVLVTGHNRDAYQLVAAAGKRFRSATLLVLDRGILKAFGGDLNREPLVLSRLYDWEFDPETQLALSPFRLDDRWIGESARTRDALLLALADFVVAAHLREGGVMERGCRRALEAGKTVYVCRPPDGQPDPAADRLIASGAEPLTLDAQGTYLAELFRDQFSTLQPDHREILLEP